MRFPYKSFKINNKIFPVSLQPLFMLNLNNINNPKKGVMVEALIDSGADYCLINSCYSEVLLNDHYTSGIHNRIKGVSGGEIDIYFHNVELEIPKLEGAKFTIPFGFINSKNFSVLLGRHGFFDKFKITFDLKNRFYDIELS